MSELTLEALYLFYAWASSLAPVNLSGLEAEAKCFCVGMMIFTFEEISSNCHTKEREWSVHWKDVPGAESPGFPDGQNRMREWQAWGHLFGEGEGKARGNSHHCRLALSLSLCLPSSLRVHCSVCD